MLFFSAPTSPPGLAVLTGSELRLLGADGATLRRVKTEAREIRWSPDGSTLLLRDPKDRLFRLAVAGNAVPERIATDVATFAWTPDNHVLIGMRGGGVARLTDGRPILLLPRAESPTMSPDGSRIAFTVSGDGGGLWIAGAEGGSPRRLVTSTEARSPSWSADGRLIAWTDRGRLRLVRREGEGEGGGERDLGPVLDPRALWSPNSPDLIARRDGGWALWNLGTGIWTPLGTKAAPPIWTGAREFVAVEDGRLVTLRPGEPPKPIGSNGGIMALADPPRAFGGETFPDPFVNAPRPRRGESVWRGRLLAFDPILGRVEIAVAAEVPPSGAPLVLARPETRVVEVRDRAIASKLAVPFDTEVSLTVREDRVVGVFVPTPPEGVTAPITPPPSNPSPPRTDPYGRALRPLHVVESDGITRETVVVPLVYPMPGQWKFTDTFLAARDGGKRRHHGNDLMAPKMTPLLAVFDGVVRFSRSSAPGASNSLSLTSDDGWTASYLHINNDTPGTDDGLGSARYAFPADLQSGDRVRAGEVVAWCGDSGNAEDAGSHLHFELYDSDGRAIIDPFASLKAATHRDAPLYTDPDPTLKPEKGEVRWEGVVTAFQAEKRALTIELTALAEPGRPISRNLAPRLVYLELPEGTLLRQRGVADVSLPAFDSIRPGVRLGAVGAVTGAKMRVRLVSVAVLASTGQG